MSTLPAPDLDTFAQGRKEKRWLVFRKVYVESDGQLIEPSDTYPLRIRTKKSQGIPGQSGYQAEVNVPVEGDPWILVGEIGSFELAKQYVIDAAKDIGLAKVMLVRAVDLYTVLYPIS